MTEATGKHARSWNRVLEFNFVIFRRIVLICQGEGALSHVKMGGGDTKTLKDKLRVVKTFDQEHSPPEIVEDDFDENDFDDHWKMEHKAN